MYKLYAIRENDSHYVGVFHELDHLLGHLYSLEEDWCLRQVPGDPAATLSANAWPEGYEALYVDKDGKRHYVD